MKVYSIFDDFSQDASAILHDAGIDLIIHPHGKPRPDYNQMKHILEEYDCVIIGTSQKLPLEIFNNIHNSKIIATASVGLDHISVPEDKKHLVKIINTPKANAQSVAEYTIACALSCCKRLAEGNSLYRAGKNNKELHRKPDDILGKTFGIIGAGNISLKIMEYAQLLGMEVICWTAHPEKHLEVSEKRIPFTGISELFEKADIVSVNLPNKIETHKLISKSLIAKLKDDAIFISVSRKETIDMDALIDRAKKSKRMYFCLDLDVDEELIRMIQNIENISITPHIAGGTIETRKRMFIELAQKISELVK